LIRNTTRKLGEKNKNAWFTDGKYNKKFSLVISHENKDEIKKILSALLMCQINNV
jgi:hypothetical protein